MKKKSASKEEARKKTLIADDDPVTLKMLKKIISKFLRKGD